MVHTSGSTDPCTTTRTGTPTTTLAPAQNQHHRWPGHLQHRDRAPTTAGRPLSSVLSSDDATDKRGGVRWGTQCWSETCT